MNNAIQKIDDLKKEKNEEYKINKRTIENMLIVILFLVIIQLVKSSFLKKV